MKTMLSAAAAVALVATLASAQGAGGQAGDAQKGDEAAIRKLGEQYAAAVNGGNARQAAAVFAEDGSYTFVSGQTVKGRTAIEKRLAEQPMGTAKTGRTLSIETEAVRFLEPDLAVATGQSRFTGRAPGDEGGGHYMTVVRRVGPEWKVVAVHTAINPPDMAEPAVSTASTGTSGRGAAAADELMAVEREWLDATKSRDAARLNQILADEFVEIDPAGMARTKQEAIASVTSGDLVFDSFTIGDVKPRVYGNTAVLVGTSTVTGKYKGEDISGTYRWTDTFVRRNGRWQVVSSQATQVMEEKK